MRLNIEWCEREFEQTNNIAENLHQLGYTDEDLDDGGRALYLIYRKFVT